MPAAGRVLVDLNFRLAPAELAVILDDCGIDVLIVDADQLAVARQLQAEHPQIRHMVLDGSVSDAHDCAEYERLLNRPPAPPMEIAEDALACISYTGGTTGRPEGVMLSHGNLLANARHNLIATGHDSRDRRLHASPMFQVAGTANVFACTWAGPMQVIAPRFEAAKVIEVVRRHRITHTLFVPTMLGMLLDELEVDGEQGIPASHPVCGFAGLVGPEAPGA